MTNWPVFICYRQDDGKEAASLVYDLLHQQQVTSTTQSGEETFILDVYFDQAAVAGKDWTEIHQPYLKTARAFIIICTPGAKLNVGKNDWVHQELNWWLQNNETAPILIDALGTEERYVPDAIAERWPNAQRVRVVYDEWQKLSPEELKVAQERTRDRLIGGIANSGELYLLQELERRKKQSEQLQTALSRQQTLSDRFRMAFIGAVVLLIAAVGAIYFANSQRTSAIQSKQNIDELIRRINVGGKDEAGKRAMNKICAEAIKVTSGLAGATDSNKFTQFSDRFWELYFGDMNIVEMRQKTENYSGDTSKIVRSNIETAMVRFGNALKAFDAGKNNSIASRLSLSPLSEDIGTECNAYLKQ